MMRPGWRWPVVSGLLVVGTVAAGCSQSSTPGSATTISSPNAATPTSAVAEPVPPPAEPLDPLAEPLDPLAEPLDPLAEPLDGVQFRDDCSELRLELNGRSCASRTPTAVPPAGGIVEVFQNGDRDAVTQMLCSALPDAEMEELLGGPFRVWTDSHYCYFKHLSEGDPRFVTRMSVSLVTDSVTEFRENDGAGWRDYPVGTLAGGYVASADGRWFRIGLSANPDLPATLLILFSYWEYGSFAFPPTPDEAVSAWERYVQRLAQYLTRPA